MLLRTPQYAFPSKPALSITGALLSGRPRSFYCDSNLCLAYIHPKVSIRGAGYIPQGGSFLLTVNHYSRPGFNAAWMAIAVSAAVPKEIHWLVTSAWTFPGRRWRRPARSISEWILCRIATIYGFTLLPPMPPDPDEVQKRALAVKQAINYARCTPAPVIGLAPEGRDSPDGGLIPPPSGVGRFINQLITYCQQIVPVGVFEEDGYLCVQFGTPYRLGIPAGLKREKLDQYVSCQVMSAISCELPSHLRGEYR